MGLQTCQRQSTFGFCFARFRFACPWLSPPAFGVQARLASCSALAQGRLEQPDLQTTDLSGSCGVGPGSPTLRMDYTPKAPWLASRGVAINAKAPGPGLFHFGALWHHRHPIPSSFPAPSGSFLRRSSKAGLKWRAQGSPYHFGCSSHRATTAQHPSLTLGSCSS